MTTPPSLDPQRKPAAIQLSELMFTMSWEDPALDRAAFGLQPGARMATVASGSCNVLTFLLDDPEHLLAFDYNPTQIYVFELKRAAFQELDYAGMLELAGVRASRRREALFRAVSPALSSAALAYFDGAPWLLEHGLLGFGRYERFVRAFRVLLRLIHGQRRLLALFEERDREGRIAFFETEWNTWAWRLLFKIFFNKTALARRGLSSDYFTFDDGSRSFADSFASRTARALCELSSRDNPFLAQYVLGRYLDESCLPLYLRPENFLVIRSRIHRIEPCVADVRHVFTNMEDDSFDAICLSNVFELMSLEQTMQSLAQVARVLRPGGKMTLRNLMVPRSVPPSLAESLVHDRELSRRLHEQDRSFVYSSFQAYHRKQPFEHAGVL